jgi:hypothetical protein
MLKIKKRSNGSRILVLHILFTSLPLIGIIKNKKNFEQWKDIIYAKFSQEFKKNEISTMKIKL